VQDHFDFRALWVIQPGHVQPDRARYDIFDPDRQLLASASQVERRARFNLFSRSMSDTSVLEVTTPDGDPLLSMIRQQSEWITEIQDPVGVVVGRIRTGGTRRHYTLMDEAGQTIAKVVGDLGLKKFVVTDSGGGRIAQVRKTRAGLFKEMLTSNDHYKIEFTGPVSSAIRTLTALVPIVLDLTLYEPE
jgi:hypothetical protein